ncbi:MAG: hypothetical protein GXO87_03265 [Chlorobi bacterium]|nr:hypothetical protein [Chlorobiota bacterium]
MSADENIFERELSFKEDFPPQTYDDWKEKIIADLKGADFEKKLITKTYEGISLQPIYSRVDLAKVKAKEDFPGFADFLRNKNAAGYFSEEWAIAQKYSSAEKGESKLLLYKALSNGQNCITLPLDYFSKTGTYPIGEFSNAGEIMGISVFSLDGLEKALLGLDVKKFQLSVDSGFSPLPFYFFLKSYLAKNEIPAAEVKGTLGADPLVFLLLEGKMEISLESVFDEIELTIKDLAEAGSPMRAVSIGGNAFTDAGASAVEELAFVLSAANEYVYRLSERGLSINEISKRMQLNFGTGPFFFMEIAKLRAARFLWSKLIEEYGGSEEARKVFIHAATANYNLSYYDAHANILRGTTETFSAIAGGANSVETHPFDKRIKRTNEFSSRVARNTQIVLKEETHLDKIIDPAGGSYYVETLTEEVAKAAWDLFKEIEIEGGFLEAVKKGTIQKRISETREKRSADFKMRKTTLVGTNKYVNTKAEKIEKEEISADDILAEKFGIIKRHKEERNKEKLETMLLEFSKVVSASREHIVNYGAGAAFVGASVFELSELLRKEKGEETEVEKLPPFFIGEPFEELRKIAANVENKRGNAPSVFLLNFGTVKEYKARADFSRGFFETGGFKIKYSEGTTDIRNLISQAESSDADVFVFCSTDNNYSELVSEAALKIKSSITNASVALAGNPRDKKQEFIEKGIDEFIFLGCDAYSKLKSLLSKINSGTE